MPTLKNNSGNCTINFIDSIEVANNVIKNVLNNSSDIIKEKWLEK